MRALLGGQAARRQSVQDAGAVAVGSGGLEEHRAGLRLDRAEPEIALRLHDIGAGLRRAVEYAAVNAAVGQRRAGRLDHQRVDVGEHGGAAADTGLRTDRTVDRIDLDVLADHDRVGDVVGRRRVDVAGRREEDAALRRVAGDRRIDLHLVDRQRADGGDRDVVVDGVGGETAAIDLHRDRRPARSDRADAAGCRQRHAGAGDDRIVGVRTDRDRRVGAGGGDRRGALKIVDRPVDDDAGVRGDRNRAGAAAVELDVDRVRRLHRVGQRQG